MLGDLNYFDARTEVMEHFLWFFTSSPDLLKNVSVSVNMEPLLLYHIPGSGVMSSANIEITFLSQASYDVCNIHFFLKDTFSDKTEIYDSI